MSRLALSYVLPLRWTGDSELEDLTAYLRRLSAWVDEVIVVDASQPELFEAHRERWRDLVRHIAPHDDLRDANGKVKGVKAGLREASNEEVVIADDDVRYDTPELRAMVGALVHAHLVRPHNYFSPLPWHARWDTGRTLLNRAFGGDYPGTLGVRASFFRAIGGYDGDVLFENLELIRSVAAAGGIVSTRFDLLVARRPPTAAHFLSQRVRQAYDDLALPARMALFLTVLPGLGCAVAARRPRPVVASALVCIALAECGRRREGGARAYPLSSSLLAPAWVLERAVTSWVALAQRLARGGTAYGDALIARSATPTRELRRRLASQERPGPPAPAGSGR